MSVVESHFKKLKYLLSLEEAEERERFRADFENLSPQERQAGGKALLFLKIVEAHFSPSGHRLLTFAFRDGNKLPVFSLDIGDVVSLSREGLFLPRFPIGTVYEKNRDQITVAFDFLKAEWLDESVDDYHLNRAGNRATYQRMLDAVDDTAAAEHNRLAWFRDVSLKIKQADEGDPVDWQKLSYHNADLNEWQKKAVAKCLEAPAVALVHGPPGTGKTTVLIEIIQQSIQDEKVIYATAPSNTACDRLLEGLAEAGIKVLRLGHPARIMHDLRVHTLDYQTTRHPLAKNLDKNEKELQKCYNKLDRSKERRTLTWDQKDALKQNIKDLKTDNKRLKREILNQVLNQAEVIVGTLAGLRSFALNGRELGLVVMDEAAQAMEPAAWIPLQQAEKVIFAGDHFQLPPTILSLEADQKGLSTTLFERFYESLNENFRMLLKVQYRMHEKIMNFSSRHFYDGELIADESVAKHLLCDMAGVQRVNETEESFVFLDTAGQGYEEELEPGSNSSFNREEAELLLKELKKLLKAGVKPEDVAVISPYSAQVRYLTSRSPDAKIEIDSVDGFQGREKEAVLLSLVRSNVEGELGFLIDTRRMNVAMTRAKRKLFVVGDSATLSAIPFYQSFIQYAEVIGGYKSTWET